MSIQPSLFKPDVEKVHDEAYKVYFRGRIYQVHASSLGWRVNHAHREFFLGGSLSEAVAAIGNR